MIKYGEIYVLHKEENMSYLDYLNYTFFDTVEYSLKIKTNIKSEIAIIFESNNKIIYGINHIINLINNKSNKFFMSDELCYDLPEYFYYLNKKILIKKPFVDNNENLKLNFNKLFTEKKNLQSSKYNCIYNYLNKEIFGIAKKNNSNINPIYYFAYDSELFTEDCVIELIYNLISR